MSVSRVAYVRISAKKKNKMKLLGPARVVYRQRGIWYKACGEKP